MSEVTYIVGYQPGFLGRIAEIHGVYYAKAWGSGAEFEGMIAYELHEFLRSYKPGRDLLLTAHVGGRLVGSIAVLDEGEAARIRWVIVEESSQGLGIGRQMLSSGLQFCRNADFGKVYLWTVEGLPQSMGLYERAGFQIVERTPGEHYSVPHMHLRLEMELA